MSTKTAFIEDITNGYLSKGKSIILGGAILDGEAAPAGGMGIARNAKDEVFNCPPIIVLIQRSQDAWLATWSKAEGVVPMPIDPVVLTDVATTLLRRTDKTAITVK